jgi:hypothetical protein
MTQSITFRAGHADTMPRMALYLVKGKGFGQPRQRG